MVKSQYHFSKTEFRVDLFVRLGGYLVGEVSPYGCTRLQPTLYARAPRNAPSLSVRRGECLTFCVYTLYFAMLIFLVVYRLNISSRLFILGNIY